MRIIFSFRERIHIPPPALTLRRDPNHDPTEDTVMLTKDILLGMNILTLAGFVVIGITLTLNRMDRQVGL